MAFRQIPGAFKSFTPCEGCEFWKTLDERSPSLKENIGRAVLELHKTVKEGQTWGNECNPVQKAHTILERRDLVDLDDGVVVDPVLMARCVLRQLTPPKEVAVEVSQDYL